MLFYRRACDVGLWLLIGWSCAGCQPGDSTTGGPDSSLSPPRNVQANPPVVTNESALPASGGDGVDSNAASSVAGKEQALRGAVAAPDNGDVLGFLSAERLEAGESQREEAERLVELLVQRYPQSPDALECKARLHLMIGQNAVAQATWEQALKIAPDYAYAQHGLGKIALRRNELEEAVEYLEPAAKSIPNLAEVQHDLSDAYLRLGDVQRAISVLRDFVNRQPDSAETWLLLGQVYLADRDFEAARRAYEKTLELSPASARAQEGLGRALLRLGEREQAQQLLQAQRENRQDAADILRGENALRAELASYADRYVDAAKIFRAAGANAEAQKVLEKAILLNSANTDAWSALLGLYQQQGNLDQAVAMAIRMCESNPANASAYYTCGRIQATAGKFPQAESSFEEVVRLAPRSPNGYDALARLYITTGNQLPRSIEMAGKAVELRGSAADYELLGQAYAVNRQWDAAHDALSRAIVLDPNNAMYAEAMRQLERFRTNPE